MKEKQYTRRTTLKRLGGGLTASVLLGGGTAGATTVADGSEGIIPPQGQDSGWAVRRSGDPIPRFTSVGDDERQYQVKNGTDGSPLGWTKYTSDRRFPPTLGTDRRLRFDQTINLSKEAAELWFNETDATADAEVTQTTALGAPFHIELQEEVAPAILSATTVGSYAGVIQVSEKNALNPKITSVDLTLSVGIIQLEVIDRGQALPGVDSVSALSENDVLSLTVTPPTDPDNNDSVVTRTEEIAEATANGSVTARLAGSGSYVVYWKLTTRTDTELDVNEQAKISFSPEGPAIGDIDPEDQGISLDEVTVELQELGE